MSLYIRESGFCEPGDFSVIIESSFEGTFAKVRADMKEEAKRVCMLSRLAQGLTNEEILALFDGTALERIEKLEAEKAESEYALGFAIDRVERLEAEKAAVIQVLERIRDESGPFNLGEMRKLVEAAIKKVRGEE